MLNFNRYITARSQRFLSHYSINHRSSSISSPTELNSKLKQLYHDEKYQEIVDIVNQRFDICTSFSIATAINACTKLPNYKHGISIRERLPPHLMNNSYVQTSFIRFYMQNQDVETATHLFDLTANKSNYMYTAMFKGLISNGLHGKVLDILDELKIQPDNFTLTLSFNACSQICNERAMKLGRKLLTKIKYDQKSTDGALNAAVHMLLKFDDTDNAKYYFKLMNVKNSITYGAIIKRYTDSGMVEKALDFFEETHVKPNNIISTLILSACNQLSNDRARRVGRELTNKILKTGEYDDVTLTTIITMLGNFGDLSNVENVFHSIQNKTITTYGLIMKVYMDNGMAERVLDLFQQMPIESNDIVRTIVFNACAHLCNDRARMIGRKLVSEIFALNHQNDFNLNIAISMCGKFGDIENAERVFNMIQNPTVFTYGSIMKVYNDNDMAERTLDLFERMHVEPDCIIRSIVLNACSRLRNDRAKTIGRKLVNEILTKHSENEFNLNMAISMFGKFGDVGEAERVFKIIQNPTRATYGAILKTYSENKMVEQALDLFEHMKLTPDNIILTIIFSVCAQLDNDRARIIGRKLLDQIPEQYRQDSSLLCAAMHMLMRHRDVKNAEYVFNSIQSKTTISYGALMNGYNLNGEFKKCINAFEEMVVHNIPVNEIISILLIDACSRLGMIRQCERIVRLIPEHVRKSIQVNSAMIDMWAKCGSIDKAKQIFHSMSDRDTVAYNIMINGFGLNGMGSEAVELYLKMPIHLRSEVTYTCILNACSHSGLYREAKAIFNEIPHKTEQITTVMVDCLSRLFLFDEAQDLIKKYEETNPPNFVMHMSLLSGLRNNRNRTMSEKVLQRMTSLFPDNKESLMSAAILVSNIYSSFGQHRRANDLRSQYKKELKTNVKQGLSWTEVNGQIEKFNAHDHSHPLSSEIYAEIDRMTAELKEYGYQFNSMWITRSMQEGETMESVLCGHSEKLAIAFNFIQRPIPDFIQVTKNLRVCGDCHEFTKLIARIRQRDIIVRDANRIHHFQQNGQCSCQDHF